MTSMPQGPAVRASGDFLHAQVVQFPVVCFTLALGTDLAYWQTENLMWQNFSSWLLFAGLVLGAIAALVWLAGLLVGSPRADRAADWLFAAGGLLVLVLALLNSLVHAGDGWTAVVPWGLALSAATVVAMIVTSWLGRPSRSGHPVRAGGHG